MAMQLDIIKTQTTWNDFTENGVVLYADTVTP